MKSVNSKLWRLPVISFALCIFGCAQTDLSEIHYVDEVPACNSHMRDYVTEIAFPDIDSPSANEAMASAAPRTISERHDDDAVEITLSDAIKTALQNNKIIRSANGFGSPGNSILANPTNTSSFYDSAILESGVLFGGRGMESALAAFDATWQTSMAWSSDEQLLNSTLATSQKLEGANFNTQLSKVFGYGGQFTLGHNWNYSGSDNVTNRLFQSAYSGRASATYNQPLWAGSGREFTAIAGPVSQNFSGLTGVNQGVLIARINGDISVADFEIDVRDMLYDVEQLYWDLYLAYRRYDTAVVAVRSAHQTWKESNIKLDIGTLKASDEAQARDRFYETRAQAESSLAAVFDTELRFRRLLGLKVNDGTVLRPGEEPVSAKIVVDWQAAVAEALTRRVELRKQKWNIKSLQLQLKASKSLLKPSLNFNAGYHLNGFGNELVGGDDVVSGNAYETLVDGQQPGWDLGLTMNVPIGFRSARAQVRNIELRTAKAMDVLATQELEITHELGNAIQSLSQFHSVAKSNFNRLEAAQVRVEKLKLELQEGTITPDPLVRAQASLATAETAYYESLTNYNKKLAEFHYRKGTLLANYNIYLSEGPWSGTALHDASRRAHERANAVPNENLHTEPASFAFPDFRPGGQSTVELANYELVDVLEDPVNGPPVLRTDDTSDDTSGDQLESDTDEGEMDKADPVEQSPYLDGDESESAEPAVEAEPVPSIQAPGLDELPGPLELKTSEKLRPASMVDEPKRFKLLGFEEKTERPPAKEPQAEQSPLKQPVQHELPFFELKELPSPGRNTVSPDAGRNSEGLLPMYDPNLKQITGELGAAGDQRLSSESRARSTANQPEAIVITDWIDLKPVPVDRKSSKSSRVLKTPKAVASKPVLKLKAAKTVKDTTRKSSTIKNDVDEFNSWKSDRPFWIEKPTTQSKGTSSKSTFRSDSQFEDYQSYFHTIP